MPGLGRPAHGNVSLTKQFIDDGCVSETISGPKLWRAHRNVKEAAYALPNRLPPKVVNQTEVHLTSQAPKSSADQVHVMHTLGLHKLRRLRSQASDVGSIQFCASLIKNDHRATPCVVLNVLDPLATVRI